MRFTKTRLALAAMALMGMMGIAYSSGARGDGKEDHGPIPWVESLPAAEKTAAKEKKVVMVDFWATWCGPCQKMLKTTYKDPKIVARAKQFVPVLIDYDKQPEVAKKYQIEAIPVAMFLDSHGKVLVRSLGYQDSASLLKLMAEAQKKLK